MFIPALFISLVQSMIATCDWLLSFVFGYTVVVTWEGRRLVHKANNIETAYDWSRMYPAPSHVACYNYRNKIVFSRVY